MYNFHENINCQNFANILRKTSHCFWKTLEIEINSKIQADDVGFVCYFVNKLPTPYNAAGVTKYVKVLEAWPYITDRPNPHCAQYRSEINANPWFLIWTSESYLCLVPGVKTAFYFLA